MSSVTDDRFLWPRVFLAVLSVGFVVVTAYLVFLDLPALDPEEHLPTMLIATPAAISVVGLGLAALGGQASRIVAALYGLVVSGGVAILLWRNPWVWRSAPLMAVLLVGAAAFGLAAMVIAARTAPRDRGTSEMGV